MQQIIEIKYDFPNCRDWVHKLLEITTRLKKTLATV